METTNGNDAAETVSLIVAGSVKHEEEVGSEDDYVRLPLLSLFFLHV